MGENIRNLSRYKAAQRAIDSTFRLLKDVGLPTNLKELNIPRDEIPNFAKTLITKYPRTTNPRRMTVKDATNLFKSMWE
jgi:alcohol dehydrogenase class IV